MRSLEAPAPAGQALQIGTEPVLNEERVLRGGRDVLADRDHLTALLVDHVLVVSLPG